MWPDYRNECHLNAHLYSLMCCAGQCVCSWSSSTVFAVFVYMLPVWSCQHVVHSVFDQFLFVHTETTKVVVSINHYRCQGEERDLTICMCVCCVVCCVDSMERGVYILTMPPLCKRMSAFLWLSLARLVSCHGSSFGCVM